MPHIVERSPPERLVDLGRDRPSGELLIVNLPKYRCPRCDQLTPFSVDESHFTPTDRERFDAASGDPNRYEFVYSDFYCRVCNSPVRVVCRESEFANTAYQYFPVRVFEIQ